MKVKVVVFHVSSKEIEVEVEEPTVHVPWSEPYKRAIRASVEDSLKSHMPEVHEGSDFMFATGFQLFGDTFETDLE